MATQYAMKWTVDLPFEEAQQQVREALKEEGFGIITEIDVRATLKEKLNVETTPYLILGACQPALAHQALELEPDIGVLLPCNVVVRQANRRTEIAAFDPETGLAMAGNPNLDALGKEVRSRIQRALDRIAAPVST
ncbi:MAG: DUF302 domain-containing protein [Armatimonadetes bacterium]|nr:DUF302 domain-containing protein [Armatimonadota bacterium]